MIDIRRREFLQYSAAALTAAPLTMHSASAMAKEANWDRLKDVIIINNLGGIDNPNLRMEPDGGVDRDTLKLDPRAIKDAHASGTTAINVTIGYVGGPMDPFEHSVQEVALWNRIVRENSEDLIKVWSTADIIAAKAQSKIGVIFGFQNAVMMGDNAERVDIFAGLGVKIIQLTYNIRNQLGDGSMVPENQGLSKFGHEVVERLNHTQTVVDLSHSGEQTCLDAIKTSREPICISHTGCRALSDLPRNKTDQELRLMADKGGVVGIYFMPFLKEDSFPNADDVVRHIEHAVNICGEDHVGIGTDGGTTSIDDMVAFHQIIDEEVARRKKAGIGATGEKPGVVPFVADLQGPEQFQKIANLLLAKGHSSARIEKILGGNFLRFNKSIWGA